MSNCKGKIFFCWKWILKEHFLRWQYDTPLTSSKQEWEDASIYHLDYCTRIEPPLKQHFETNLHFLVIPIIKICLQIKKMVRWSMYPKITTCKKEYTTREPKTETHFNQIHYPCTHFVDHMVMTTENTKERSIGLPTTLIAATTATTTAQASASLCLLIYMDLTTVEAPFSFFNLSLSLSLSLCVSPLCLSWPATMARSALPPPLTSVASISSPLLK